MGPASPADMCEATHDFEHIVAQGHDRWAGDKYLRLAARKLLEIIGEASKAVS
ncbi:MAG: hypothetical protein M3O70_01570 [Actinomycetota bacterium]|nr:hypothetical protein [Actinomycetota bacterium]